MRASKRACLGLHVHLVCASCLMCVPRARLQLSVMSRMTPLAFSVLTPVIKAMMICLCSVYFHDPFGLQNVFGVAITTAGGFLFTMVRWQPSSAPTSAKDVHV